MVFTSTINQDIADTEKPTIMNYTYIMHLLVYLRFYCLLFLVVSRTFCIQELTQECTCTMVRSVNGVSRGT